MFKPKFFLHPAAYVVSWLGAASLIQPAHAFVFPSQRLTVYSSPGVIGEVFVMNITTEDTPTSVTNPGYTNPGVISPGGGTPDTGNPLLTSQPYTFTGYRITAITGKRYEGNVYNGDIRFNPSGATETGGVFNYPFGNPPSSPIDLIAHALPDHLWNPGGRGYGFTSTPSIPSGKVDNFVSIGGIAFDVLHPGTQNFDEPYQLFTVAQSPGSGAFTSLSPGDYAGCPGSCVGATVVPAPLPFLGFGVVLGCTRRLQKLSDRLRKLPQSFQS
jgi:hypothetical protein